MTAIMGPSGSGKSTLMHIVGLLDEMDEGQYILNGREVQSLTDNEQARARNAEIGFVFQSLIYFKAQTSETMSRFLIYAGVPAAERRKRAESMLERVGLLPWAEHRPGRYRVDKTTRRHREAMINRQVFFWRTSRPGILIANRGARLWNCLSSLMRWGRQ